MCAISRKFYEYPSLEKVLAWYVEAGRCFLDSLRSSAELSASLVDELAGRLVTWQIFEDEYVRRGYRALDLHEFSLEGAALAVRLAERQVAGETVHRYAAQADLAKLIAEYHAQT